MSLPLSLCRHIKSSLSLAFLYVVPASSMFLILVDNQSWRLNQHSRSAGIWESMVTKVALFNPSLFKASVYGTRKGLGKEKKMLRIIIFSYLVP